MKTIASAHYALCVCASVAMLAGCGGSAQFPNSIAQTPIGNARAVGHAASRTTEALSATNVHFIGNQCVIGPGGIFRVIGGRRTASGPYPGTFTAHGSFGVVPHHAPAWYFSESLKIKSGTSTIAVTILGGGNSGGPFGCESFGPARLRYTSDYGSGDAQITVIQRGEFSERLHNL